MGETSTNIATLNMNDAFRWGNRLIMMGDGHVIYVGAGEV